jgi:glycerol-3-phosphate O-acyltransferase
MSRLYGLNAPEFFDARLFRNFIDTLIARGVVRVDPEGRLSYADVIGEVTRASSVVLPADFRQAVMRARPQREAAPQPVSERAVPL